eukprot:CAMPEP_0170103780 /NCGR_PEP_ID=MMETSP0020_2-20130122/3715_1 /TAXON_ID=98059 /ORGANISM="Dinobryon sp., Strain UTEXLB2267" /LENGTH=270 /DNA_ID=CAMNT_0010327447 /DNA_START=347 /DNA_END=1159 /DNA_ORIENTATION=-
MQTVWSILTDYNNLATHVPNLVQSYLVPAPNNGLRLFQEGAQKIIGFDFRASLLMDMNEEAEDENRALRERMLSFKLVESRMFSSFDGSWTIRYHSRSREYDDRLQKHIYTYKTKLTYTVLVKPKGPVPVLALEWRIKEDIPVNLLAVKLAAERIPYSFMPDDDKATVPLRQTKEADWGADETLGSYIPKSAAVKFLPALKTITNNNNNYKLNSNTNDDYQLLSDGTLRRRSDTDNNMNNIGLTTPFLYLTTLQKLLYSGKVFWNRLSSP